MRYIEIVGEITDVGIGEAATGVVSGLPDDFSKRLAATQRDQGRQQKLRTKVRDVEAKQHEQQRAAAEKRSNANERIRDLKRQINQQPA